MEGTTLKVVWQTFDAVDFGNYYNITWVVDITLKVFKLILMLFLEIRLRHCIHYWHSKDEDYRFCLGNCQSTTGEQVVRHPSLGSRTSVNAALIPDDILLPASIPQIPMCRHFANGTARKALAAALYIYRTNKSALLPEQWRQPAKVSAPIGWLILCEGPHLGLLLPFYGT